MICLRFKFIYTKKKNSLAVEKGVALIKMVGVKKGEWPRIGCDGIG